MLGKQLTVAVLALSVALFVGGCASGSGSQGNGQEPAGHEGPEAGMEHAADGGAAAEGAPTCPVTGNPIPQGGGFAYQHEGKEIRFCCQKCVAPFEKDPQKYLK